jgi:hypothetical protein
MYMKNALRANENALSLSKVSVQDGMISNGRK